MPGAAMLAQGRARPNDGPVALPDDVTDVFLPPTPYKSEYEQHGFSAIQDGRYFQGDDGAPTTHHWYYGEPAFHLNTNTSSSTLGAHQVDHVDMLATDLMKKCVLRRPPQDREGDVIRQFHSPTKPLDRRRTLQPHEAMIALDPNSTGFMHKHVLHSHGKHTHLQLSDLQREVFRYRGILRAEDREGKRLKDLRRRPLQARRDMVQNHGVWLATGGKEQLPVPLLTPGLRGRHNKRRLGSPRPGYWGGMVEEYGLQAKARTSFQTGAGHLLGFGIRNSVCPAKRQGVKVKRVGSLVAICNRSFEEERARPNQPMLNGVIGRSAKVDQLRYKLRYRMLCAFLRVLESPLNPPGVTSVNIDKLHERLQDTAHKNPQPWFVSRTQFVNVTRRLLQGVDERMAHQLLSCYDPMLRDRVRFAEITSNLLASTHSSTIALSGLSEDMGPYKVLLTVLRASFRYYTTATGGKLTYLTLLDMFRSYANRLEDVADIDQAFRSLVEGGSSSSSSGATRLESEVTLEEALEALRVAPQVMEVMQGKLSEFQALMIVEQDKELARKNRRLNRESTPDTERSYR